MFTKASSLAWLLGVVVLVSGCQKSATSTPQSAPAHEAKKEAWQIRREQLAVAVKVGMSEDAVTKAIGEPSRSKSLVSANISIVTWEYDLGDGYRFKVRFDKNSRVAAAELDTTVKIQ